MSAFLDALAVFHFLRPLWLLLVPVLVGLWWLVRRKSAGSQVDRSGIAPHLADALTVGQGKRRRWLPIDSSALVLGLLIVAASGPTWSRVPNPFLSQTAPMVVVLEVTRSMQAPDLPPNRLDRAKFKILDLVGRRAGARTGLVAYAGSAHRVAPLTEDPEILRVMLDGLKPEIMPVEGNDAVTALALARSELARSEMPGAILLVTDGADPGVGDGLKDATGETPVIVLFAAPESEPAGTLENASRFVRLTADDSDLDRIERAVASAFRAAQLADERLDWEDRGWVVAWPAALILLFWFRRGWTMRRGWVILVMGLGGLPAGQGRADVIGWFLTPDQQGALAYRNKEFAKASEVFQDPMWRGLALMKSGSYADAADLYSRIDTPEAAFAEGYARIRNREYRPAIAAYERALELRPDFPEAAHNLEVSKVILDYVETAREESDTGEDRGIGADEVVFDNESKRGADTQTDFSDKEEPEFATTEQWMRSVDTEMSDFLRMRFLIETASGESE